MGKFLKRRDRTPGHTGPGRMDGHLTVICSGVGFVLLALSFMWVSQLKSTHDLSMEALRQDYAAQIAAARYQAPSFDSYKHDNLPEDVQSGEVDLAAAAVEVAGYQDDFVDLIAAGAEDFDVYKAKTLAAWANMEQWFPNDSAHAWYVWDPDKVTASWHGYDTEDAEGRPMCVWLAQTRDGTLLACAMAWYAGDHMFAGWSCYTTEAGLTYMDRDEYSSDPLAGTYESSPGDGDNDGRPLEDHVDSALDILDGLGLSHGWFDAMIKDAQEKQSAEGGDDNG